LKKKLVELQEQRIVVVGAGSAGVGVSNSLAWTMIQELGMQARKTFKLTIDKKLLRWMMRLPDFGCWTKTDCWVQGVALELDSCVMCDKILTIKCPCWK
jgi:malic enzyme